MLTEFTSYDEIRAAIGVAQEEIPDVVLALPNYEYVLDFDLDEMGTFSPTMIEEYRIVQALSTSPAPTVDEARFVSILKVYAAYVIARHLLNTLPMFAPQIIKDSKTELQRQDPYEATRAGVESFYLLMRARLLAAYGILFPLATITPVANVPALLAVGLASDPVLGA